MAAVTYIDDHEARAIARLPDEFRTKAGWIALMGARAAGYQRVEDALKSLRDGLPLEDAETAVLARWSKHLGWPSWNLGADQPIVDDDEWLRAQLVIRRKALGVRNADEGPIALLIEVANDIDALFSDLGTTYRQDEIATVLIGFQDLPTSALAFAHAMMRRLVPPSVRLIVESRPSTGYFGWDGDADAAGFGTGTWTERYG
jgi:hypothetical protein